MLTDFVYLLCFVSGTATHFRSCIDFTLSLGVATHFRHCIVFCLLVLQPTSGIVLYFVSWCCNPLQALFLLCFVSVYFVSGTATHFRHCIVLCLLLSVGAAAHCRHCIVLCLLVLQPTSGIALYFVCWCCSPLQALYCTLYLVLQPTSGLVLIVLCLLVLQPTSGIVFIVFCIWCCRPLQLLTTSTMLLHCFLFIALVFHPMIPTDLL